MMESFLGVPDTGLWLTLGLVIAATVTTFLGTVTGTAGGLLLLAIMTFFFPLGVLIPMHTLILAGMGYPVAACTKMGITYDQYRWAAKGAAILVGVAPAYGCARSERLSRVRKLVQ